MWRAVALAVGLVLGGCAEPERAVTGADVWAAAGVEPTVCSAPESCLGYTAVPPGALRERLGAPEWTGRGDDLLTMVGDLRLTMSPSTFDTWMLNVVPLRSAQPEASPQPGTTPADLATPRGEAGSAAPTPDLPEADGPAPARGTLAPAGQW